ncbi:MAG: M28 family peptidase [Planctomycetota bacterium]
MSAYPGGKSGKKRSVLIALSMTFFLAFVAFCGVYQVRPPDAVPANGPDDEFSSARAVKHLKTIAAEPHPIGSPQQQPVRDYLLAQFRSLGLNPQIQKTQVVRQHPVRHMSCMYVGAATVQNIVARLPGTASSKTVLLMSHYDSARGSPAASDDGSGVVTMLETLRALNAGPPLKNDVVFLVTDGEEIGLFGAKGFVDEHPWAADVGLVLNFEARGTSGPVFMFETSGPNAWLTAEFGTVVPYPATNSLAYEIYKRMPNNTDLTIFKEAGVPGLNFAHIGDSQRYHTCRDNIENLDPRSVQHHGSYALALTRHFGNLDLSEIPSGNAVYFNPIGSMFVRYPERWSYLWLCALPSAFSLSRCLVFGRGS